MLTAIIVLASLGLAFADPSGDQVTSLPGLSTPINFKHYAGYLMVNPTSQKQFFYWFAESQNAPTTDPLVLWLNGGPGCSSLGGMFTENGPFVIQNDTTSVDLNPYSWNNVANVIWLESPAGVGFSYSNDKKDYTTGDVQTAEDNLAAVLSFFEKFPEYAGRQFFVTGESYGGHYIPELVTAIVAYNLGNSSSPINLKGFSVGNGLFDEDIDFNSPMPYFRYHALISPQLYASAFNACNSGNFAPCSGPSIHPCPPGCNLLVSQANQQIGNIFPYNIYQAVCESGFSGVSSIDNEKKSNMVENDAYRMMKNNPLFSGGLDENGEPLRAIFPPCESNILTDYLNDAGVKTAIHANPTITWTQCSNILQYNFNHSSMFPLYANFFANSNLRILIYSGDADSVLPFLGTEADLVALNRPVQQGWRPWTASNGEVAGYVTVYDKFSYLTIKGAGHMVPGDLPLQALDFFTNFIRGTPY